MLINVCRVLWLNFYNFMLKSYKNETRVCNKSCTLVEFLLIYVNKRFNKLKLLFNIKDKTFK